MVAGRASVDGSNRISKPHEDYGFEGNDDVERPELQGRPCGSAGLPPFLVNTLHCIDPRRCFGANPQGKTEANAPNVSTFRWVLLGFCFALIAATGAAIFNWVDLRILLLRNGAMIDRCDRTAYQQEELRSKGQCDEQMKALDDAFNIGVVFIKLAGVITGPMLDIAGPRCTGIFGLVVFSSGLIFLGLNLVLPGVIFLGAASNPIFNCAICVGNLFPKHRNLVISVLSAAGDLCIMNFLIMRLLSDAFGDRVPPKTWLLCYITVPIVFGMVSMNILPRSLLVSAASTDVCSTNHSIEELEEGDDTCSDVAEEYSESTDKIITAAETKDSETVRRKRETVRRCGNAAAWRNLKTPRFWYFLLFFMLLYFKKINYMRNVEDFLRSMTDEASEGRVTLFVTAYSGILCSASLFSLLMGAAADYWGISRVLLVVNGFSCLFSGLSLVPILDIQIATFISFTIFKSFVLSSLYCFAIENFGCESIGFVTGMQQVIAGLFCLLNIPFQWYIVRRQWWINHVVLLGLSIIAFVFPIYFMLVPPHKSDGKAKRLTGYA